MILGPALFSPTMRYRFADCVLDDTAFTLTRDGEVQSIEPQVFDLLHLLVRNPRKLISRDQLIEAVWSGRQVSDSAITARVAAARRAVGDDGKAQSIIRTVPRRGIQFVADVAGDDPTAPHMADALPRPTVRYASADDGAKIAYATSGTGPPLLRAAHHPTHLELEWIEPTDRTFFDRLGESHTLIRVDHRGCGLSDLDVDNFSAARSAEDLKAVADALGLDRLALLGCSNGAMVAIEFAARYPQMVSRLVLLGGYVDGRSVRDGEPQSGDRDAILKMAEEGWETPDSAFVAGYISVYLPTATQEQVRRIARDVQNSCPVENEIRGREFYNNHSVAHLLAKVKAPTLVLHCRGDAVHPLSEGQKLAKGIPDAQLAVLESRNHYPLPQEECWQTMMSMIEDFLAGQIKGR